MGGEISKEALLWSLDQLQGCWQGTGGQRGYPGSGPAKGQYSRVAAGAACLPLAGLWPLASPEHPSGGALAAGCAEGTVHWAVGLGAMPLGLHIQSKRRRQVRTGPFAHQPISPLLCQGLPVRMQSPARYMGISHVDTLMGSPGQRDSSVPRFFPGDQTHVAHWEACDQNHSRGWLWFWRSPQRFPSHCSWASMPSWDRAPGCPCIGGSSKA